MCNCNKVKNLKKFQVGSQVDFMNDYFMQSPIQPPQQPQSRTITKKFGTGQLQMNPYIQDFNMGLLGAGVILDGVNDARIKRQEQQRYLEMMQPRPRTNYNEAGLDNIPVYMQKGGSRKPIPVTDRNDPRYKAYMDSINKHNIDVQYLNKLKNEGYSVLNPDQVKKDLGEQFYNDGLREAREYGGNPFFMQKKNPDGKVKRWFKSLIDAEKNPNIESANTLATVAPTPVQPYYIQNQVQYVPKQSGIKPSNPQIRKSVPLLPNLPLAGMYSSKLNPDIKDVAFLPPVYPRTPAGEAVYAPFGENSPLLGFYSNGEFTPDNQNPNAAQYNSDPEFMSNLIKRNYGTEYKKKEYKKGGEPSAEKAAKILHDGKVYGKKLTKKQRKFFGAMVNKMQQGGVSDEMEANHNNREEALETPNLKEGQEVDLTIEQIKALQAQGYDFDLAD